MVDVDALHGRLTADDERRFVRAHALYERWWPTAGWRYVDGQRGDVCWQIQLYKDDEGVSLSVWVSALLLDAEPEPLLCIALARASRGGHRAGP